MKNSIFKTSILAMILGVVFVACEKSEEVIIDEQNQIINTEPTDDAVLPTNSSFKSEEVARIQKDGYDYTFIAIGEEGDMVVNRSLYGNTKRNSKNNSITIGDKPFDIFIKVTDPEVSVPLRIAQTSTKAVIQNSGRKVLDSNTPIKILDSNYLNSTSLQKSSCAALVGPAVYSIINCQAPVVIGPGNLEYCNPILQTSLVNNTFFGGSWRNPSDIYTNTNHCGDTSVEIFSWVGGAWILTFGTIHIGDGDSDLFFFSPVNTARIVVKNSLVTAGCFRSFIRFQ